MAIAISAIAIRAFFFPCCDSGPRPVMRVLTLCDSVRPVPDGRSDCDYDGTDTFVMIAADRMLVSGGHPDTITIPRGGAVQFFRRP
jgi:hypothetical protein